MIDHEAIRALYPEVVNIYDESAYDADGNEVIYDRDAVETKSLEIQAEYQAKVQAQVDARQSALNKLMALGLTEEEALALGVK